MRAKYDGGASGRLALHTEEWLSNNGDDEFMTVLQAGSSSSAYNQMTVRVEQKINPLAIMLKGNLPNRFYSENADQNCVYKDAEQFLNLTTHKSPEISRLKLNDRTESATSWL